MIKVNKKIFPKTFFQTLLILCTVVISIHILIYLTFPSFYVDQQRERVRKNADIMVGYLSQKEYKELPSLLESYAKNISITAHLKSDVEDEKVSLLHDLDIEKTAELSYVFIEERSVWTRDNKHAVIQFVAGSDMIKDAINIAMLYLPFTFAATLTFAFVFSYFYSKRLQQPLAYIETVTKKMENMEIDAHFSEKYKEEIGSVGEQINRVYEKLLMTIADLEAKNKDIVKMQEQKISFMRGASHELKTPLASIRIILENMKYNIGKYKNKEKYLDVSISKIDDLSKLLKDILESSKFQEWTENREELNLRKSIDKVKSDYEELSCFNNITLKNEIEDNITINMSKEALDRVLSNIISNAIKYSKENEDVKIYNNDEYFMVENKCSPLSDEQLENLFKIFYHSKVLDKNVDGTGLGLYIVKNILDSYKMKYEFIPYEEGMRFKIKYLQDKCEIS